MARFELKDISDGMRSLSADETSQISEALYSQLVLTDMGDDLVPDRSLYAPATSVAKRILEGTLGIQGAKHGTWTEQQFDTYFSGYFAGGCYFWIEPYAESRSLVPLFWAPYSAARRDWLYVHASNMGMRPCGITSLDKTLSLYANLDCDYTFVFGDYNEIEKFDTEFGGKDKLCREFNIYLGTVSTDFGGGDIYAFMKKYLPLISGCSQYTIS